MKKNILFVVVLFFSGIAAFGQFYFTPNSPIRITQFTRDGLLSWSNSLCPLQPVYEIVRANSPTGAWQHHLYVTNQTTAQINNPFGSSNEAVYVRVFLVGDTPMTFNYSFIDPGFCAEANGVIRFGLVNSGSNYWNISVWDYFCGGYPSLHPDGSGPLYGGLGLDMLGNWGVRLSFSPGSEGIKLRGRLRRATIDGECGYDSMSGEIYLVGFAGESPIGTFTATRVP